MLITRFKYGASRDAKDGWQISEMQLQHVNLFVGKSGSGKTIILNRLFGLGINCARASCVEIGFWSITFKIGDAKYTYELECLLKDNDLPPDSSNLTVNYEMLLSHNSIEDSADEILILKKEGKFSFGGNSLPRLPNNQTGIYLFKDEEVISDIHKSFIKFKRRQFDGTALSDNRNISVINDGLYRALSNEKSLTKFHSIELNLSQTLFILHSYYRDRFNIIEESYRSIFVECKGFKVEQARIATNEILPIVTFTEDGKKWNSITSLSSGMLKVLLILTDLQTLGDEAVYFLDEYENSLGINAIDFLPDYLVEYAADKQILMTSHHPYIINNIPIKSWLLVSRSGFTIKVTDGSELEKRYERSKQKAFIQLINDPLYQEG